MIKVRNLYLHKDKKSVRDGINVDKIKYFIFVLNLTDLIEFKLNKEFSLKAAALCSGIIL